MRKLAYPLTICAAMFLVAMLVAPAQATFALTWVASNGSDSADCSRTTPCATFLGAYNKTSVGGEIVCVDSGPYGGLGITKSITINCENAIGSNIGVGGGVFHITVNTAVTDAVTLKGLDLDGRGGQISFFGPAGMIDFIGAGVLHVEKVKINNIRDSGIRLAPNGPALLDVSDSTISDNGSALNSAGILIRPVSGGSANVTIDRVRLLNNVNGIFVDGTGGGGPVNVNVRDSVVTGSANVGIVVSASGPALTALIDRTTVNSSLNAGVAVSGAAATVRIGNSKISGNVKGVLAVSGGNLRTYKNNEINFNLTDGTPINAADALN